MHESCNSYYSVANVMDDNVSVKPAVTQLQRAFSVTGNNITHTHTTHKQIHIYTNGFIRSNVAVNPTIHGLNGRDRYPSIKLDHGGSWHTKQGVHAENIIGICK